MSVQIDLNYRPGTYWPESLDQEQLLSRIQGESRRTIARNILAEEGFAGLSEFLAQRRTIDAQEPSGSDLVVAGQSQSSLDNREAGGVHEVMVKLAAATKLIRFTDNLMRVCVKRLP